MIRLVFLILVLGFTPYTAAQQPMQKTRCEPVGDSFRVHGRLSVYIGNPSCRIWVIGTNRILGIREVEEECLIPPSLSQILHEEINNRLIFADFIVSPLTEYKEGVMQSVRIESAENVVVTERDMRFLRRVSGVIK
jgi:predicted AlkP superfamily pyrophosphatase or phosphodiesterase